MLWPALAWIEVKAIVCCGTTVVIEAVCCATPAAKLAVPVCTVDPSPSSTVCQTASEMSSSV
jgi:hypothetical protein